MTTGELTDFIGRRGYKDLVDFIIYTFNEIMNSSNQNK